MPILDVCSYRDTVACGWWQCLICRSIPRKLARTTRNFEGHCSRMDLPGCSIRYTSEIAPARKTRWCIPLVWSGPFLRTERFAFWLSRTNSLSACEFFGAGFESRRRPHRRSSRCSDAACDSGLWWRSDEESGSQHPNIHRSVPPIFRLLAAVSSSQHVTYEGNSVTNPSPRAIRNAASCAEYG